MWAVGGVDARNASIDAQVVLTGKAGNAIVRVIASGSDAQTPPDLERAHIVGVATVFVAGARATADEEATFEGFRSVSGPFAPGFEAHRANRAVDVPVAKALFVGAVRAERAHAATRDERSTAAGSATKTPRATVSPHASTTVSAGAGVRVGGSRIATTGRRCNDQHEVSKATHVSKGAAGRPRA